ncbi:MAG TPA: enoyl-CoA hydratase/isomerase family protein [Acidimicrobiia bacterium]|nr:enoyl-CoA hydratase/isomerase family protein [Acidimicrobiia bacterium]
MSDPGVLLEFDGPVAIISNNRPDKHNAFTDAMDRQFWNVMREVHDNPELRAIVWRGNGPSFSSGRDTTELGVRTEDVTDFEYIERGHAATQMLFTMPHPIVVALKGWAIGGSFERALLCDLRIAGESTKIRLPEVLHGVSPDSCGVARLFQIAGHGVASDMALTGRMMDADEALRHGVVSRVVPDDQLDETALQLAHHIAEASPFAVKMARRVIANLAHVEVQRSIADEAIAQAMVFASNDYAEMKAARGENREPHYRRR